VRILRDVALPLRSAAKRREVVPEMRDRPNAERQDGEQRAEPRTQERAIGAARGRGARGSHGRTLPSWSRYMHHGFAAPFAAMLGFVYEVRAAGAEAALLHDDVEGRSIATVDVGGAETRFEELENARAPGLVTLRFRAHGDAVLVPHCAGRERVVVGETTYP